MALCRRFPLLMASALILAACRDEQVSAYRVAKEKDPELPAASAPGADAQGPGADAGGGPMAGGNVDVASGPGLSWTAPADWTLQPAQRMRKATYAVPAGGASLELAVTAFPGSMGGEFSNLNRWRGQAGLPPLDAAGLPEAFSRFSHNGLEFAVADVKGPSQGVLAAMVPFGGSTWFFKLSGPAAAVPSAQPAFLAFLQTVQPSRP